MKIKRFVAPDMRTAFAMVRQEHGPDAVILSNRVTEDGVEIVAASNYDEALVKHTLDAMRPAAPSTPLHPRLVDRPLPAPRPTTRSIWMHCCPPSRPPCRCRSRRPHRSSRCMPTVRP